MQEKRVYNLKRERIKLNDPPKKVFHGPSQLPSSIDLRDKLPPIYDQGALGSCTAQVGSAAYSYLANKPPHPSRLFLYYNERMLDNDISYDAGSSLYQCVNALEKFGICPEKMWPYDINKFVTKPPQHCYDNAKKNIVTQSAQINQSINDMKTCLVSGLPILLGIQVYPSFESEEVAATGNVPLPGPDEQTIGGHALLVCGYDDNRKVFIVRNSWTASWGDKGYCYIPYDYLTDANLCSDLWTIKKTSHN